MTHLGPLHGMLVGLPALHRSIVNLDGLGHYVHWHFIQISVANLIVIISMLSVFVLAIAIPFPRHGSKRGSEHG